MTDEARRAARRLRRARREAEGVCSPMSKSPFHAVMDFLSKRLLQGQIFCLIMMTLVVFAQIVLREVFKIGIQWAFELACFFQVTLVFQYEENRFIIR